MPAKRARALVREPLQVYLTSDERRLLDRLAADNKLSRAEVLRQGIQAFAKDRNAGDGPMLRFMERLRGEDWPTDIGRHHDRYLEDAALDRHEPKKKKKKRKTK